jgi:thiol-disulfide isomerase/thioredoxin
MGGPPHNFGGARGIGLAALLVATLSAAAPALHPLDEHGFEKMLRAHRGKVVLVDFWATWCVPCREDLPALVALDKQLRRRGFVLVTVSADEPEQTAAASELLRQNGVRPPAYRKIARNDTAFINFIDGKWSGALPALFLYDRQGRRVASFIGETEKGEIEAAVRKLL